MIAWLDRLRRTAIGRMRSVVAPVWHHSQGYDMTECGKSTLIMSLLWAGNVNCIVASTDGIWYWGEMLDVLKRRGQRSELAEYSKHLKQLGDDKAMIVRVRALGLVPHYVFVSKKSDTDLLIADPLDKHNTRLQTPERLMQELVGKQGILVHK